MNEAYQRKQSDKCAIGSVTRSVWVDRVPQWTKPMCAVAFEARDDESAGEATNVALGHSLRSKQSVKYTKVCTAATTETVQSSVLRS